MSELKALGAEIGLTVNAPSAVKGTRWLPHVSRSLKSLLKPEKDGNVTHDEHSKIERMCRKNLVDL